MTFEVGPDRPKKYAPSKQPSRTRWSQGHLDASLEGWALEGMVVVGRQVGGKGKEKNGEINTLPRLRTSYLPETRPVDYTTKWSYHTVHIVILVELGGSAHRSRMRP